MKVLWLDTVDSTNNEARRRIESADSLSVVAAKWQTAGRGQRGNTWSSAAGENLTFSVTLKLPQDSLPAADQFAVSEASAIAVADFLSSKGISVRIKWPNDIYAGDLKMVGILIENTVSGQYITRSIAGIGINVNQTVFRSKAPNPVSMAQIAGHPFDLDTVLQDIVTEILDYTAATLPSSSLPASPTPPSPTLTAEFHTLLWRNDGLPHRWLDTRTLQIFEATVSRVDPAGPLLLRLADNTEKSFYFKEVAAVLR